MFQQAVEALWPSEPAYSLIYTHEKAGVGAAVDLRTIRDPASELGQFWTLSIPSWMRHCLELGSFKLPAVLQSDAHRWRRKRQHPSGRPFAKDDPELVNAWTHHNPFMVVEIDYLLFGSQEKPGDTLKRFQTEAVAFALQASGFPFTVLIDSGSKSVHAIIRLTDSPETVHQFRNNRGIAHFIEVLATVLGEVDVTVLKTSGTHRLVRTPGAVRDNGRSQSILAIGQPTSLRALLDWCYRQLRPEVLEEMRSRPAQTKVSQRKYRLRDSGGNRQYGAIWRRELLQEHSEHRGEGWFKVSNEIARCGLKAPKMISPPSNGGVGVWEAPFLWWLSAYVYHQQSGGWFFSDQPRDWGHGGNDIEAGAFERTRWPDFAEIQGKMQEDAEYAVPASLRTSPGASALYHNFLQHYEVQEQERDERLNDPDTDPNDDQRRTARDTKAKRITAPLAIQYFLEHYPHYLLYLDDGKGGEFVQYNGKIWEPVTEMELLDWVSRNIEWWLPSMASNSIRHYLRVHHLFKQRRWEAVQDVVVFRNGTYMRDPEDGEWKFFANWWAPEHYARTMIPHDWAYADNCPQFKSWLAEYLPDPELQAVLQEWTGYLFTSGQRYQKFLMMLGTGGNGKGVYMQTVSILLGHENVGAFHLASLGGRFSLASYIDKMLIYDGDADEKPRSDADGTSAIAVLKKWTGGDPIALERKNQQPFTMAMSAKCIMSANVKPRWVDPSKGLWRRMIPLPWEVTVPPDQVIEDFHERFRSEIGGVVGWAVQGLARLTFQGGFTKSKRIEEYVQEYRAESDAVMSFIDEYLSHEEAADKTITDLRPVYECYKTHCESLMNHPCSFTQFKSRLQGYGVRLVRARNTENVVCMPLEHGGRRPWCLSEGWRCTHPLFRAPPANPKVIAFPAGVH